MNEKKLCLAIPMSAGAATLAAIYQIDNDSQVDCYNLRVMFDVVWDLEEGQKIHIIMEND